MKEIHHPAEKKSVYEISHSTSQDQGQAEAVNETRLLRFP
jgi:hypothetical protein